MMISENRYFFLKIVETWTLANVTDLGFITVYVKYLGFFMLPTAHRLWETLLLGHMIFLMLQKLENNKYNILWLRM